MSRVKNASDHLHALHARSIAPLLAVLYPLVEVQAQITRRTAARMTGEDPGEPVDAGAITPLLADLGDVIASTQGTADMLGREQAWLAASRIYHSGRFGLPRPDPGALTEASPVMPSVPFVEAIGDIASRAPKVVAEGAGRAYLEVQRIYNTEHGMAFAKAANMQVTKRVQGLIARAIEQGLPVPTVEKILVDVEGWTRAYAENVYRTNVSTAYSAGRFRQVADPDVARVIGALRFDAVGDSDTRKNHKAADGLIAAPTDPIWHNLAPPLGYNSFLPGTRISGQVLSGSKTHYSGPVVTIFTREGRRLSVTPNHPVFEAARGFVAAGSIAKGDHLVSHGAVAERLGHRAWDRSLPNVSKLRRAVHDEDMPPKIEDFVDALLSERAGARTSVRSRPLALDFHGDAMFYDGQIDVVSADAFLPYGANTTAPHRGNKRRLVQGQGAAGLAAHRLATLPGARPVRLSLSSDLNATVSKPLVDDASAASGFLRQLKNGDPGGVSLDEVVDVQIGAYVGHVYDVQSPFGWIVADGTVASNCRCSLSFVDRFTLERLGLVNEAGTVRPASMPAGAGADQDFVHDHRPDVALYGGAIA